jgi:hypothetical protein
LEVKIVIVQSEHSAYAVGKKVADAGVYRLYLCAKTDGGPQCLLAIAAEPAENGKLDRAAYLLSELKSASDGLEAEYARVQKKESKKLLNYDLGFPELVDSFVSEEQGGRRINILAFRHVDDVNSMIPIANITAKDRRRIDLRTSVWIMGKVLKLLVFAHDQGIAVGRVNGTNILIEPEQHYVVLFDWSEAKTYPDGLSSAVSREEIAGAANAVITLLGGDLERALREGDGEAVREYVRFLTRLASGGQRNAQTAHTEFYDLVDRLWKRAFHPFTSYPLS